MATASAVTRPVPRAAPRQRLNASALIASRKAPEGNQSALAQLEQRGGAKIRLPRTSEGTLSAVTLNTAGGLTGDDHIRWDALACEGSRLTIASAASEKIYRTHGPAARQDTHLRVDAGARLDWLPQETIVFDGARLHRRLDATLARGAQLLVAEALVFGRQASGERIARLQLHDRWRVQDADGRLLHAEDLRLGEDWRREQSARATLDGACAIATVLFVDDGPSESLERQTDHLHTQLEGITHAEESWHAGVSALPGRLVARFVAPNGYALRRMLLPTLERLQGDQRIPRVWYV